MNALLNRAIENKDIELIKSLLDNNIYNDFDFYEEMQDNILSYAILETQSIKIIELLLKHGINTGFEDTNGRTPLGNAIYINRLDIASLLLEYGAIGTIDFFNPITGFSLLEQAIIHCGIDAIRLLLEHGADTCIQESIDVTLEESKDYFEEIWTDSENAYHAKYSQEQYQILKTLLNPNNPPYLKLSENEEDKYIIYENEFTEEEVGIYLLADKKKYKDKKYLYADNKIDVFVYWAYTKKLINEVFQKVIAHYLSISGEITIRNLNKLMRLTIGESLTLDDFTQEGAEFASEYLTVTHWWYNLHTDFSRLYQEEGVKLPRAAESQEEFDTLLKLLDIRHEQFKSGKDFSPNQNKEELQALIEGREPPKREVDLSFNDTKEFAGSKEHPIIRSGETAPKSGIYQAYLPPEHPYAQRVHANPASSRLCIEGMEMSPLGLNPEIEEEIRWEWVRE